MEEEERLGDGGMAGCDTGLRWLDAAPDPSREPPPRYLEVQVQNPHLVHEEDPVADLPDKHHGVHLSQMVVLVHNPLEELAALDAVCTDPSAGLLPGPLPPPQAPPQ